RSAGFRSASDNRRRWWPSNRSTLLWFVNCSARCAEPCGSCWSPAGDGGGCGRGGRPDDGDFLRAKGPQTDDCACARSAKFHRDPRGIRAKSIVIAHAIDNSRLLPNFLPQDIAKNAALAFAVPFAGGAQFVQNTARDKSGCGHL